MSPCGISLERLIDYRFGEDAAEAAQQLEEHMFSCEHCARRVDFIVLLGDRVRELVRGGALSTSVTSALLRQVAAHGLQLREYHIDPGQSVACTAAPQDDFVVVQLALGADSMTADRVDIETEVSLLDSGEQSRVTRSDVVVDRERGELCYVFAGAFVRTLPRSRWVMHATLTGPRGTQRLGPYVMDHTPWDQLPRH